jgi:hypothetical protein
LPTTYVDNIGTSINRETNGSRQVELRGRTQATVRCARKYRDQESATLRRHANKSRLIVRKDLAGYVRPMPPGSKIRTAVHRARSNHFKPSAGQRWMVSVYRAVEDGDDDSWISTGYRP